MAPGRTGTPVSVRYAASRWRSTRPLGSICASPASRAPPPGGQPRALAPSHDQANRRDLGDTPPWRATRPPGALESQFHGARHEKDMAPDLVSQRPSKSPSFTRETNTCHSARLSVTYPPSLSAELRIRIDSPRVPISTQAPPSHRPPVCHVGSCADLPPITIPRVRREQDFAFEASINNPHLSIACSSLVRMRSKGLVCVNINEGRR